MRSVIPVMLVFCLAGCGDLYRYARSGEVGWALKKEIRDNHVKEVAIANLTRFQWDEFFVFDPYVPTGRICEKLGLSQPGCGSAITSASTSDGEMLLVFRHKGNVVHTEMHLRWHGDFSPAPGEPFTPESAVFAVVVDGEGAIGGDWLRLRPKFVAPPLRLGVSAGRICGA